LKEGGVSIPSKAINYLTPVSSHKNWVSAVTTHASAETPYVCFPNNAYMPLESKKCFEFEYPSLDTDHSRFVELRFRPGKLVVHGFVGYFESVLHSKVLMSIKPESHSKDMGSWFPMYFPIKQPILCINHDLVVRVWRCASSDRVWYEWEVMTEKEGIMMQTSGIHNPNGKTYWIGKV
jgi:protein arginine N-methyltransferase 5